MPTALKSDNQIPIYTYRMNKRTNFFYTYTREPNSPKNRQITKRLQIKQTDEKSMSCTIINVHASISCECKCVYSDTIQRQHRLV